METCWERALTPETLLANIQTLNPKLPVGSFFSQDRQLFVREFTVAGPNLARPYVYLLYDHISVFKLGPAVITCKAHALDSEKLGWLIRQKFRVKISRKSKTGTQHREPQQYSKNITTKYLPGALHSFYVPAKFLKFLVLGFAFYCRLGKKFSPSSSSTMLCQLWGALLWVRCWPVGSMQAQDFCRIVGSI